MRLDEGLFVAGGMLAIVACIVFFIGTIQWIFTDFVALPKLAVKIALTLLIAAGFIYIVLAIWALIDQLTWR